MTAPVPPSPHRRRHAFALLLTLSGCASTPLAPEPPAAAAPAASAPAVTARDDASDAALQARFTHWLDSFRDEARAAGITDATLHAALDDAHCLPRLVAQDRAQPEFTRTTWDYLDAAVSAARVARGQARLAELRDVLDATTRRYGVPGAVVVAIWGIESDYGADYGQVSTIDALATLGAEGRREAWARAELLAALRIVQAGDIDRGHMIGSWAGAMGQTQFLPSAFLSYAVDADGDGRRDIWGSMPDVVASTANFLARVGWRAGEPWGAEVRLPAGFDVGRADGTLRQPSARWTEEGVQAVGGGALPAMDDVAILLPAGARGPAFLVGANFRAILRYNNAASYALAVGLLSQQLAGGPAVQGTWPRDLVALSTHRVQDLQSALTAHGFDSGAADGKLGPATRDALRRWQRSVGLPADGYPTPDVLERLQVR